MSEQKITEGIIIKPHDVAIFATTYYKTWQPDDSDLGSVDSARGNASLETFRRAAENGFNVIMVDGGSSEAYLEAMQKLGVKVFAQQKPGMVQAKREALAESAKLQPKVFVLIQAEKTAVIPYIMQLIDPIAKEGADLVMAGRDQKLFKETYPSFQVTSEETGNKWCNKIARQLDVLKADQEFDWFFGVKAFRNEPELVKLFMTRYQKTDKDWAERHGSVDPERYTNFDFFPVLAAMCSGRKVIGVTVPFSYPPEQKAMEENLSAEFIEKRRQQKESILTEVVQFARYLTNEDDPKSHLKKEVITSIT
ncbi:hypothetical protein KJ605_02480 [Patescibacteria group bacterium]|nr:hypothetical protein [Patescibacteria group bacterium]MBU1970616.1 hypothetical protein [Patescibacteria group bacterium]